MVGVLPGMGPLATISILPLTFGIKPVGVILSAGVMYSAQYGGAICSILLNLPRSSATCRRVSTASR